MGDLTIRITGTIVVVFFIIMVGSFLGGGNNSRNSLNESYNACLDECNNYYDQQVRTLKRIGADEWDIDSIERDRNSIIWKCKVAALSGEEGNLDKMAGLCKCYSLATNKDYCLQKYGII